MNPILRNCCAVLIGLIVGSAVNSLIIKLGHAAIPLPEGPEPTTVDELREAMTKFEPIHFLTPFLAHALGTLAGAFIAIRIAVSRKCAIAIGIGVFFLIGGIMMVVMVGGPLWFKILDLVVAYIPMAWIGSKLAVKVTKSPAES